MKAIMIDHYIIGISAVLALFACILNIYAACTGPYALRVVCVVRGSLAGIYFLSYVWLFLNSDSRLVWSKAMVGVSLFTWVAVWNYPAIAAIRLERRTKKVNRRLMEEQAK